VKNQPIVSRRLLKTTQASTYLGISPWQLRRLVGTGQLPVVQIRDGARFLLDVRDLDAFIDRNKTTHDALA
jgi:excisionase family DNA binding protein